LRFETGTSRIRVYDITVNQSHLPTNWRASIWQRNDVRPIVCNKQGDFCHCFRAD